ncbi:CARNS1, partial [Symbiodinium necroappetens]
DPRLTYPFAVRTGKDDDVIVGTVIQWPSAAAAKEQIASCNQIEGFRASQPEAGLYRRALVKAQLKDSTAPPLDALMYHQIWPSEMLRAVKEFPDGDWLAGAVPNGRC